MSLKGIVLEKRVLLIIVFFVCVCRNFVYYFFNEVFVKVVFGGVFKR